jgi:hypothetical protein
MVLSTQRIATPSVIPAEAGIPRPEMDKEFVPVFVKQV